LNIRSNVDDSDWSDNSRSRVKIIITMPTLDLIDVENDEKVSIKGFSQKDMKISLFGNLEADIIIDVENLTMDIEKANVDLQGKGTKLEARVEENGELRARQYTVKTATIDLKRNSEATIYATESVNQKGDADDLDVTGGAEVKEERKRENNE
jgi:hypothetical protein